MKKEVKKEGEKKGLLNGLQMKTGLVVNSVFILTRCNYVFYKNVVSPLK